MKAGCEGEDHKKGEGGQRIISPKTARKLDRVTKGSEKALKMHKKKTGNSRREVGKTAEERQATEKVEAQEGRKKEK